MKIYLFAKLGVPRDTTRWFYFLFCFWALFPLEAKCLSSELASIHYFVFCKKRFQLLLCHFLVIAAALVGVYGKHANMWTRTRLQLFNQAKVLHFILVLCIFLFSPQPTNSTRDSPPNDDCVQKPLLRHVKSSFSQEKKTIMCGYNKTIKIPLRGQSVLSFSLS